MKDKTIEIKVECRGYWFRAIIRRKTGTLVKIRAGCRTWKTFEEAFDHYNAHATRGFSPKRWSDAWLMESKRHNLEEWLEYRIESRRKLRYLATKCHERRLAIRRARR